MNSVANKSIIHRFKMGSPGICIPLGLFLSLLLTLLIGGTVGLIVYFSFITNQQAINNLANRLMEEVGERIDQHLTSYLGIPHLINDINVNEVKLGTLNLDNLPILEKRLYAELQRFETVDTVFFVSPQGILRGAGRSPQALSKGKDINVGDRIVSADYSKLDAMFGHKVDQDGNKHELVITVKGLDVRRDRPWYKLAVDTRKPGWTPAFQLANFMILTVNAYRPLYEPQTGALLGVFSVNLTLNQVGQFLRTLKATPSQEIFIIDSTGFLIASSADEAPFSVADVEGKQAIHRMSPEASQSGLIRQAGQYLKNIATIQDKTRFELPFDNQLYYIQVRPYRDQYGLDWRTVVLVPESDFMVKIDANTRLLILFCGIALLVSVIVGNFAAKWVTKPIAQLNAAAKQLANGGFIPVKSNSAISEVGGLAQSFNDMAQQLAEYNWNLEVLVNERTLALEQEVTERKRVEETLKMAEAELRQANHELEILAYNDALTKVANRRYFDDFLYLEWQRSSRVRQPLSVILLDIDYFKLYNDCYGHQAGDRCLAMVAESIKQVVNCPADKVARYGGEEFAIVLPNTPAQGALIIAERIRQAIQNLEIVHERSDVGNFVTVSLGIATAVPADKQTPNILVASADRALYDAKQQGRNRVCCFG